MKAIAKTKRKKGMELINVPTPQIGLRDVGTFISSIPFLRFVLAMAFIRKRSLTISKIC